MLRASIIKNLKYLFVLCFVPLFARADIGIAVAPQKFDLVIFPGETFEGEIRIKNQSKIALPISVKALPFGAQEGTGEMEFQKPEKGSPVFWFKFKKSEMILEPEEKKIIKFEIKVPPETEPGGYYVFVYFEPRFPSQYFEGSGPKTIPVVGIPFLISTSELLLEPQKGNEFEVMEFSIPEKERVRLLENLFGQISKSLKFVGLARAAQNSEILFTKKSPSYLLVKVKNNDIYHLKPFGTISFYNFFGKKIGELKLKGETILPGKSREFKVNLSDNLHLGILGKFKAELDLKAQSPVRGEINLVGKRPSLSFFPLSNFYFLIFTIIILTIGYLGRRRIKLALKVLIWKKTKK